MPLTRPRGSSGGTIPMERILENGEGDISHEGSNLAAHSNMRVPYRTGYGTCRRERRRVSHSHSYKPKLGTVVPMVIVTLLMLMPVVLVLLEVLTFNREVTAITGLLSDCKKVGRGSDMFIVRINQ
ncbi:unnamed protein product, partial [Meganyctiphanes norvegica]